MNVVVDLVPDDYRWYFRYSLFHLQKLGSILLIGFLVVSGLRQLNTSPEFSLSARIADQIALTLIFGFLWWIAPKLAALLYRGFKMPLGEHRYEITEKSFRGSNVSGSYEVLPPAIREARETDRYFLVVFETATAAIIPKRDLPDAPSVRVALNLLRVRWSS